MKWLVLFLVLFVVGCSTTDMQQESEELPTKNTFSSISRGNTMKITSEFAHNEFIQSVYTCDGDNTNPKITIKDIPRNTESVVLIMDDPDIPQEIKDARGIEVFDHWVVFNIPVIVPESSSGLPEHEPTDSVTVTVDANSVPGVQGLNGRGESKYTGPCPPPQYQPTEHRYFFKVYALDSELELGEGATKKQVEDAMEGHIIEKAELVGKYDRS